MKKILILLAVFAVAAAVSVVILSHKAPGLLIHALEKSLGKKISIRSVHYDFPGVFQLEGFEMKEIQDFPGEASFSVDKVRLDVSALSLSEKKLIINSIEIENADIVLRKFHGKLIHALSDAATSGEAAHEASKTQASSKPAAPSLPLEIHQLKLTKSHFKFIDYDIQNGGFIIALDDIDALIDHISLPFSDAKTSYKVSAFMSQGQQPKAAQLTLSGRTQFQTKDTDSNVILQGVYLPYFEPYYRQVTPAAIESAYLDSRIDLLIEHDDLSLDAELGISELSFRTPGPEEAFFGLRPDELLSFLKDRSGRLKCQVAAKWNITDSNLNINDVIRKSIERSLKKTVIGNVGNILQNTLQKMGDQSLEKNQQTIEDGIKRLKNLLKN